MTDVDHDTRPASPGTSPSVFGVPSVLEGTTKRIASEKFAAGMSVGALAISLVVVCWFTATGRSQPFEKHFVDLQIYLNSVGDFVDGKRALYCYVDCRPGSGWTYPPIATIVFMPLIALPATAAKMIWTVLNLAVVVCGCSRILRGLGLSRNAARFALSIVLVSEPVRQSFMQGQISAAISVLLMLGLIVFGARGGFILGLAASIKVTPALALMSLVSKDPKKGRWLRSMVLTGIGLTLLGFAVFPRESMKYFMTALWDVDRVGPKGSMSNNSIAGLAAHLGWAGNISTIVQVIVTLGTLTLAGMAARNVMWSVESERGKYALILGLAICVITPVSWTHHCLIAPLAAAYLAFSSRMLLGTILLSPWMFQILLWSVQHRSDPLGQFLAYPRVLSLLIIMIIIFRRLPGPSNSPAT